MTKTKNDYLELKDELAEQAVLGAIIIDGKCLGEVADFLKQEHFYSEDNADIYRACLELYRHHKPVDIVTIRQELKKDKSDITSSTLTGLVNQVATSGQVKHQAVIVFDTYTKRRLYEVTETIRQKAVDPKTDLNKLIAESQNEILKISQEAITEELLPDSDKLADFLAEIDNRKEFNAKGKFVGMDTGFKHLNEVTLGLQPGLWIIGARPSLGKTTFAKQLLDQVAMNNPDIPCLFVSYEQSGFELLLKSISRFAKIDSRDIQKGRLNPKEEDSLNQAIDRYSQHAKRIYLYEGDGGYTTVEAIQAKARQLLKRHKADKVLVVIDYLQLIPFGNGFYKSDKERLDRACSDLRRLARELNSPIVAVSSLNRPSYVKGGKADLSSFKESGGIEYSADLAMTMNEDRQVSFELTNKNQGKPVRAITLKIHKNRNGERARIDFRFDLQTATFTELSKGELEEEADPVYS